MFSTPQDSNILANDSTIFVSQDNADDIGADRDGLFARFCPEGAASIPRDMAERVERALIFHGVSPIFIGKVLARDAGGDDAPRLLSSSLGRLLRFSKVSLTDSSRIMLAGAPGVGKSSMVAKLTACAPAAFPSVFTTDTSRPGGAMRLIEYLGTLDVKPRLIDRTDTGFLPAEGIAGPLLIDTAGIDTADLSGLRALGDLASAMSAELVLVMSALSDPIEARDLASAMQELGATKLLVTRLDMARRLGAVIAAAEAGLAICQGSVTANFAYGLTPLSAVLLADRLLDLAKARFNGVA